MSEGVLPARHEVRLRTDQRHAGGYAPRMRIYPKRVRGPFRRIKWVLLAALLGLYYLLPWLRWDRGPGVPDQAVLVDFLTRRIYVFGIEIWPDEIYVLAGLLILAALVLFWVTALFGRVWCGFFCPQTVWTDLYMAVERLVEGDRAERIRLDKSPWTAHKFAKKAVKHLLWLLIAAATGGAWIMYFNDAPTVTAAILTGAASVTQYFFFGLFTATTYLLAGIAREQVCIYMCPWPRIQGALVDQDTLAVTYERVRGEPRGPLRKGAGWDGRGDCIDCGQCVAVCPMGVDIRDGFQLGCIGCALCIDACNQVMDRIGRPRWLIAYDSERNLALRAAGKRPVYRLMRPRTWLYAAATLAVAAGLAGWLLLRSDAEINVLHDRNPLYVTLSDGSIRNGYTLKILNKTRTQRRFALELAGIEGADVRLAGPGGLREGPLWLEAPPDGVASQRLFVTVPPERLRGERTDLRFLLTDLATGRRFEAATVFRGPGSRLP